MAISNELSSEIAAALMAQVSSPEELEKLRQIVLEVHTTLQTMSEDVGRNIKPVAPNFGTSKTT